VLILHSEIAKEIAAQIQVALSPAENAHLSAARPVNPAAHEAVLKAKFYRGQGALEGYKKSFEFFQRAIQTDPNYAVAWAGLAEAYASLGSSELLGASPEETMLKARSAAQKAIELDPSISVPHVALGLIHLSYDWDWANAEKELRKALELSPNDASAHHWSSHLALVLGRFKESLAASLKAIEIDPLNPQIGYHLAWHYLQTREYDQAIKFSLKVLEMYPENPQAREYLALAYLAKGMPELAVAEQEKAARLYEGDPLILDDLGFIYAKSGRKQEALQILEHLTAISKDRYVPLYQMASTYAALGNRDKAFELLEKAYQIRSGYLPYLKLHARFDSLRSDPRFADLVKRVGIP
jgi:tetratricopeptide (TPR) repeat protein